MRTIFEMSNYLLKTIIVEHSPVPGVLGDETV